MATAKSASPIEWDTRRHLAEADRLDTEASDAAEDLDRSAPTAEFGISWIVGLVATTLTLAALYFYVVGNFELPGNSVSLTAEQMAERQQVWQTRGLFGDQWGAFTGLMSGLSLAFVALSLLAQRTELRMNRIELALQRIELKQTRAQAHRQIAELKNQRASAEAQARYTHEPILHAHRVGVGPHMNGIALNVDLIHAGAPIWNARAYASLALASDEHINWHSMTLPAVVTRSPDTVVVVLPNPVRAQGNLAGEIGKHTFVRIWLSMRYQNVAGGRFAIVQYVDLPGHLILTATTDPRSPVQHRDVRAIHLTQGDTIDVLAVPDRSLLSAVEPSQASSYDKR